MSTGLSTRPKGQIHIYACGGGGINIGKEYHADGHSGDIADFKVTYIDTSDSNMEDRMMTNAWLFDDLDGSGKIRESNASEIAKVVPDILNKFTPGDLNVVVFTASGGTGSVAGPLIMRQLLQRNCLTMGIVIGSHENDKTCLNTYGSLKTLDKFAKDTGKPVVIQYNTNEPGTPRSTVDREAHLMITALAMLASRRNHGLDTADLVSFFQFNKSTPVPACLARIHLFDDTEQFDKQMKDPISAAYLKRDHDDPQPLAHVPYSCDGFMPDYAQTGNSLFFGIENASFNHVISDMAQKVDDIEKRKKTRGGIATFVDEQDNVDDVTGLIL